MSERKVDKYISGLFPHGLEGYDKSLQGTPTKAALNAGGAKVFFHQDFRTANPTIIINHPGLDRAIKDAPVIVYALNRVELDDNGVPVMVNNGYRRIYTGLMLYVEYENMGAADAIRARLLEAVPEVNLADYIEVGSKIHDPENKLSVISDLKHQNFARELVSLKKENCIFLALPSGAPGSTQFWSFQNKKSRSRQAMSSASTASTAETDDLPF